MTEEAAPSLNVSAIKDQLYNSVVSGGFENALSLTNQLKSAGHLTEIGEVVTKLLDAGVSNVLGYSYRLWSSGNQDLIAAHFPPVFKSLLNGDVVSIVNEKDGLPLKLQVKTDDDGDRQAWGDGNKNMHERTKWRFVTVWENNNLFFKIVNEEYNQYLKLVFEVDNVGDRKAFGSKEQDTFRHQWYVRPAMAGSEKSGHNLVFYIVNRKYDQALKLGRWQDEIKDRIAWGHSGSYMGEPQEFAWQIKQFYF